MTVQVELHQLLSLALGTPEVGAVNFNILHGVLREIIKHLGIEKKVTELAEDGEFRAAYSILKTKEEGEKSEGKSETDSSGKKEVSKDTNSSAFKTILPGQFGNLESKLTEIEKKLEILDDIPSNSEILQRAKQKREKRTPVGDMWQFININRRLGATETGIEKLTSLLDNMMGEVNDIKELTEGIDDLKKKLSELEKQNSSLAERISALESVDNTDDKTKLEDLLKELRNLKNKVDELPTKEDLDNLDLYVKWPQLEEALTTRRTRTPTPKPRTPTPQHRTPTPPPRTPTPAHPSHEAMEALRQVGELMDKHEDLADKVEALEEEMPKKANLEDLEELKKRPAIPADILDQLKRLRDSIDAINKWREEGGGTIDSLRNMLLDLQAEQEKLNNMNKEFVEEHNRKQKHIDALYTYCDRLQENKADKEQVAMEIDVKADKRSLDNLISRLKFDQSISTLDQAIQDLLNRLDGNDAALKDALSQLTEDVDRKLDRMELDPLRDYFEKRIKSMKCKHADLPLNDDPAAGFRKALLRFHCISCDRPVDMAPGHPNPALPHSPGMSPSRTGRPYTTFELDQIRQMNRGAMTYEQEVAMSTARSCGGGHTVTYPHRRTARFNQYYYYREEEVVPVPLTQRDETELVGHDGHIYKGRFDEEIQQFPEMSNSPRQKSRSPRATSAKRATSPQLPRTGSPTHRRPHSAAPSSPRSLGEGAEPGIEIAAK